MIFIITRKTQGTISPHRKGKERGEIQTKTVSQRCSMNEQVNRETRQERAIRDFMRSCLALQKEEQTVAHILAELGNTLLRTEPTFLR